MSASGVNLSHWKSLTSMSRFEDSQLTEPAPLELMSDSNDVQLPRVAKQLDKIAHNLQEVQLNLSSLAVRYEYIVTNMEKEQLQMRSSLGNLSKELDNLERRINKLEQFMWKFSGGLVVIVFISQFFMKYFGP